MHSLKSRLIFHILSSRDNYQNISNIINPPLHVYDPLERQGPCGVFYKVKKIKIRIRRKIARYSKRSAPVNLGKGKYSISSSSVKLWNGYVDYTKPLIRCCNYYVSPHGGSYCFRWIYLMLRHTTFLLSKQNKFFLSVGPYYSISLYNILVKKTV